MLAWSRVFVGLLHAFYARMLLRLIIFDITNMCALSSMDMPLCFI